MWSPSVLCKTRDFKIFNLKNENKNKKNKKKTFFLLDLHVDWMANDLLQEPNFL